MLLLIRFSHKHGIPAVCTHITHSSQRAPVLPKFNIDVTSLSLQHCTSGSSPVIIWYVCLALQFCLVKHRSALLHRALGFVLTFGSV